MYIFALGALSLISTTYVTTIDAVQGSAALSTYIEQILANNDFSLTNFIPSEGLSVFWPADANTNSQTTLTGIIVYSISSTTLGSVKVDDLVSLSAKVSEYRSRPNDLHPTELISPTKMTVLSSGNRIVLIVLGRD